MTAPTSDDHAHGDGPPKPEPESVFAPAPTLPMPAGSDSTVIDGSYGGDPSSLPEPVQRWGWLGSIWVTHRASIRAIVKHGSGSFFVPLVVLFGASQVTNYAPLYGITTREPLSFLALMAGCVLAYIPVIALLSWLYYLIGILFEGRATPKAIRAAILWSNLPIVVSALIAIAFDIGLGIFDQASIDTLVLNPDALDADAQNVIIASLIQLFLSGCLGLWSLVILVRAFSEIQQFGPGIALGAILIGSLIWALISNVGLIFLMVIGVMPVPPMIQIILGGFGN